MLSFFFSLYFQSQFIFFKDISVFDSELRRQRISNCIPEIPVISVCKLLNSNICKVNFVEQIIFYFSSFQVQNEYILTGIVRNVYCLANSFRKGMYS